MSRPTVRSLALATSICIACLPLPCGSAHANDSIKIGGTGAATELLRRLGSAFLGQGGIAVDVVPSLGSSGGISAVVDGVLDLAVSGRALKAEESSKGLAVPLTLRTPFVLASSHPKPDGLRAAELPDAFVSERAAWSDGTAIRVILRPRSESDTALIGELFPGVASAIEKARRRPDIPIAATDQDNADLAEHTPGSLVGSTFMQIKAERRNLRAVAIDGIEPTFENFERGHYRYQKVLYFVTRVQVGATTERFVDFLRSAEGQRLLREAYTL